MSIDLDSLHATGKTLVKKSLSTSYMPILHAVPLQSRTKVQKSIPSRKAANTPKQPVRKAEAPKSFPMTRESVPSSSIGNVGRPNATSNVSGAPAAKEKPSSWDALYSAINALAAAVTISARPKGTANIDAALRAHESEVDPQAWNSRRSAAQRQGFTYHGATKAESTVDMGKSAHAVRMQGNKFAPAPVTARKTAERQTLFSDSYMDRLGRK